MHAALVHFTPVLAVEKDKAPYYIAGGALVLWALAISLGVGLRYSDFPRTVGVQRRLMLLTAILVVATLSTAVITSGGAPKAPAPANPSTHTQGTVPAP
jgi:hypothetical protein